MMNKATDNQPETASGDLVLQEVWRAKDALSAAYGHDLDKLFAQTRQREKHSGHRVVNFHQKKPAQSASQ